MIQVIRPGTKVHLVQGEIENATVTSIQITPGDRVLYKVVWWDGPDRKEQWLESFEVSIERPEYVQVGFMPLFRSQP